MAPPRAESPKVRRDSHGFHDVLSDLVSSHQRDRPDLPAQRDAAVVPTAGFAGHRRAERLASCEEGTGQQQAVGAALGIGENLMKHARGARGSARRGVTFSADDHRHAVECRIEPRRPRAKAPASNEGEANPRSRRMSNLFVQPQAHVIEQQSPSVISGPASV